MLVYENYATQFWKYKAQNKSKITYLLLIKHDIFFILSYTLLQFI